MSTLSITFKVPGIPSSMNNLYRIIYSQKRVYLSQEGRLYKDRVKTYMPPYSAPPGSLFALHIDFYNTWLTKKGTIRKKDLQNLSKLIIDAVFEKIGIDDSRLWELTLHKIISIEDSHVIINLRTLDELKPNPTCPNGNQIKEGHKGSKDKEKTNS